MHNIGGSEFLTGAGEIGDLIVASDWGESGLGPPEQWPSSLKNYASMILKLPTAAVVFWGPELIPIYNKSYADMMGPRHLGARYDAGWTDTDPMIYPCLQKVRRGEVLEMVDTQIIVTRYGYPEEAYFSLTWSPLRDAGDGIAGALQLVTEVTDRVLSQRRLATRRALEASSPAPQALLDPLADASADVPFAILYLWDDDSGRLELAASCGLTHGQQGHLPNKLASPALLKLCKAGTGFELCEAADLLADTHCGRWEEPTNTAAVYALPAIGRGAQTGLLVLGISPRLRFDEPYRSFLDEVARTLAANFSQSGLTLSYQALAVEQRAASQALVLSEQRHYTTLKSIGDAVITTTTELVPRIDFMNAVAEELTGWSLAEAKGQAISQIYRTLAEETRLPTPNLVELALAQGHSQARVEHQVLITKGGAAEYIIEDSASLISGADGGIRGVVLVFRNLTEKRRYEKERAENQRQLEMERRRLQSLFNQAPLPICMLQGPEHVFVLANPSYAVHLGRGRALLGKTVNAAFPELVDQGFLTLLDTVYQSGRAYHGTEVPVRLLNHQDSSDTSSYFLNFVYQPMIDLGGKVEGILVIATDVTAQVLARRAIEASEARYRSLADSTPQIVWSADMDGILNYISVQGAEYSGSNVPADWFLFVHPDDADHVVQRWQKAVTTGQNYDLEFRLRRRDGCYRWHLVRARPFRDAADKIVRWDGTCTDIDEQKNLAEELRAAKVQAENATKAKSAFLANMSHEIRTPLGIILGFSEFLLDPLQSPADRLDCVLTLRRNADQLASLINELLDLSKIEADRLEIEKVCFPLQELIEDVYKLMKFKAKEKGIDLRIVAVGSLPRFVESDPTRLRQILINIIDNAIKFTPRGSVEVSVAIIRGQNDGESSTLKFVVKDTGIGLSVEQQEKIWEPFVQGDSSTTRKFGGSGLGLALSRRLARALGGDLQVERSELGKGTAFVASVAIGWLEAQSLLSESYTFCGHHRSDGKEATVGVLEGAHILLVEDSVDNQRLAGRILKLAGARVELASDGEEGCQKAMRGDYDLVLMDVQMPKLDGYEATALLRAQGYGKPIIALTAHAMKGEREKAIHVGFDDYLAKPIDRRALVDKLSHYLGSQAPQNSLVEFDDDPEILAVIDEFRHKHLPVLLADLDEAVRQAQQDHIADIAHRLRGSLAHYFAPQINEISGMIEDETRGQGRRTVLEALVKRLVVPGHSSAYAGKGVSLSD